MQSRRLTRARAIYIWLMAPLLGAAVVLGTFFSGPSPVATALTADNTLNFQARLYTSSGGIVPDGNYNIDFKIYNADSTTGTVGTCTGACLWEETWTNAGGHGIPVVNGYFSVRLNSINNNWSNAVNWDQQYYLTMNVTTNGTQAGAPISTDWNGEMQNGGHSIALTAVPLAFRSNQLGAVVSNLEQVLQFNSSFTQATTITLPDPGASTATVCYQSATACGFAASSGSGNYIQNSTGGPQSANFNIISAGSGSIGAIVHANASQSVDIFDVQSSASTVFFGVNSNGTQVSLGASNPTIAATASNSNLSVKANGTGTLNLNNTGTANTTQIGNTSGAVNGIINLGTNATSGATNTIHIGDAGTATDTITIGSTSVAGDAVTIETGSTGNLNIGNAATTHNINIGSANGTGVTQTVNIASGSSTTSGGVSLNLGNGTPGLGTNNTINIGSGGTTTGTVNVTIGSNGAVNHTTVIQGGSGTIATTGAAIKLQTASAGDIQIGSSSTTSGIIAIGGASETGNIIVGQYNDVATSNIYVGNSAGASSTQNVYIANSANGVNTVNLGSVNSSSASNINGGTGGINLTASGSSNTGTTVKVNTDSTLAFQVENSGSAQVLGVDTANQLTSAINLQTSGTIALQGSDGGSILLRTDANSAIGVSNVMSFSGYEITDESRAVNTQGDGRQPPDSSTGIWEGTTNLNTNGGFESSGTGTTGWAATTVGGGTPSIARKTIDSKFGQASMQFLSSTAGTLNAARYNVTLSTTTTYTASAWIKVASGAGATNLLWLATYNSPQVTSQTALTNDGKWHRYSVTFTTDGTSQASDYLDMRVSGTPTTQYDIRIDGVQLETKQFATPYVDTSGSTAARNAAGVSAPVTVLGTPTQGWAAVRLRLGFTFPYPGANWPGIFDWGASDTNSIQAFFSPGSNNLTLRRTATGGTGTNSVSTSMAGYTAGQTVTLVFAWTSNQLAVSVNGANFVTAVPGATQTPTLAATTFGIGVRNGATANEVDSDMLWMAAGSGPLTNTDALNINRLGNSDPSLTGLTTMDSAVLPTFAWDGETNQYSGANNAPTLQSGISIDDSTLYHTGAGALAIQGSVNSATAFQVQNAAGVSVLTADTTNGQIVAGTASSLTGKVAFATSAGANNISIVGPSSNPGANYTITIPTLVGNANLCVDNSNGNSICSGYAPASGSGNYIQNQVASLQTANFKIQSAATGSVVATIEGASGQTADLLDLINATTGNILTVSNGTANTAGTNVVSINGTSNTTGNSTQTGLSGNLVANPASASTGTFQGIYGSGSSQTANTSGASVVGGAFQAAATNGGNVGTAIGVQITNVSANLGGGAATIANSYGLQVTNPTKVGSTITKNVGVNVDNQSNATNNTNLLLGTTTIPTGNYSIYNSSAYNNFFGGPVAIQTNSATAFQVQNSSAANLLAVDTSANKVTVSGTFNLARVANPGAPTVAINATAGNLNGTYFYVVTFVTASGESNFGTVSASVSPVNQQVNLTNIPTSASGLVTARKIYRTVAGGPSTGPFFLVNSGTCVLNDNVTTSCTDNVADGSLGAAASNMNNTSAFQIAGTTVANVSVVNTIANAYFGSLAGQNNTIGVNNSAFGDFSLQNTTTGSGNTAVGENALLANTTGSNNTAIGSQAGYQDPGATTFATLSNLQNATAIGYGAEAQASNVLILGGVGTTASNLTPNVGIGTTSPDNLFSISPDIYDTGNASVTSGTAGVTGSGTTWTSSMVGDDFIFADGTKYTVQSVGSTTSITLTSNASTTETSSAYRIHNPAFYVTSTGQTQVRSSTNSTTAFQVQNASNSNILGVDTTAGNSNLVTNGDFEVSAAGWTTKGTASAPASTTTQAYQGTHSGNTTVSAASSGMQYSFTFGASTQYQLTFYARCSASINTFTYGRQDNGVDINNTTTATCSNTGWTAFTWHFTTGGTIGTSNIYMTEGTTASGTLYIDAVSLIQTVTNAFEPYVNGAIQINGVINTPTIIVPQSNSTNTFNVENTTGTTSELNVDTLNNRVNIVLPTTSSYGANLNVGGTTTTRSNSTTALQIESSNGNLSDILNIDTSTTNNLVTNSDFEVNGTTGWAVKNGSTLSRVTTQQWQGNGSLQVAGSASNNSGASYNFTMGTGTQYTLSLYARVASGSISDFIIGRQDVSGTDVLCFGGTNQTLTTSWQRFVCSFTTGGTITNSNIFVQKTGGVAETFFIDGVQLQTGGSVSAYNPGGAIQLEGIVNSPVAFQNKNDSTTAFQVQSASGANVLSVDTLDSLTSVQGTNSNAVLGAELAGSIACSGTNWAGSGTGPWTHTTGSTVGLVCSPPSITANTNYVYSFSISGTAGYVIPVIGGQNGDKVYATDSNTAQFWTSSNTTSFTINPTTDFNGSISSVSIKTLTQANPVLTVNNSDGTTGIEIRAGGSGLQNTFIGSYAGYGNTSGQQNAALGYGALDSNTTGNSNVGVGAYALLNNISGSWNTAIGQDAMQYNSTGFNNTAVGEASLLLNSTGSYNIALGGAALGSNTSGYENTAGGYEALTSSTTAADNTAFGAYSQSNTTIGGLNSSFGAYSLGGINGGQGNTAIGYNAGDWISSGNNNTALGYKAGDSDPNISVFTTPSNLQNATMVGYGSISQENNSIILGSVGTVSSSLQPNVGIGTTSPDNTFSISPDIYDTGTASVTSGTAAVSGSGTTWTANMVGDDFIFPDGTKYTIQSVGGATSITLASNATATETNKNYRIHNPAFYVSSTGQTQVRTSTNSTTAFQVQNASGTSVLTVDTTNTAVNITGSLATQHGTDISTTGNLNNLSVGGASLIRLTGASTQTVTGIAGGRDGYRLTIVNAGSSVAIIKNNDSTDSSAANVIITGTGADLSLAINGTVDLVYDSQYNSGTGAWRAIAGGSGSGGTSSNYQVDYKQITSNVSLPLSTTTKILDGNTVNYDGSTPVEIQFFTPGIDLPAQSQTTVYVKLYEDGSFISELQHCFVWVSSGTSSDTCNGMMSTIITPTAGSHYFSIYATTTFASTLEAGNGTSGNLVPAYMRIVLANPGFGSGGSGGSGSMQLDYNSITSGVSTTATTEGTATTVISGNSINYDGTQVRIEVWAPNITYNGVNGSDPNSNLKGVLFRDSTPIGQFDLANSTTTVAGTIVRGAGQAVDAIFYDTPSTGNHTYVFKEFATAISNGISWTLNAGNGTTGNLAPAFISVTRLNPLGGAGGSYIQNGTTVQQANFNVQSSSSSSVTAVIQGASGQSVDILDIKNSSNTELLGVDQNGNLQVAGNIGFQSVGNANQALTINENITGSVTAGDVVVIDTANPGYVKDTTTVGSTQVVGIATKTQTGGSEPIVITGIYQVNVSGTVTPGDYLVTSSTSGQAADTTSPTGGIVGQAMSTASSGQAWALIKPQSGAGGGSSGSVAGYTYYKHVVVTSGTNFIPDPGVSALFVQAIGGGGGSGGGNSSGHVGAGTAGGGGGGGAYSTAWVTSNVSSSLTIQIGSGGTAGSTAPGAGGNGGETYLEDSTSAKVVGAGGGTGAAGVASTSGTVYGLGGAGGTVTAGTGWSGQSGIAASPTQGVGFGGYAPYGAGPGSGANGVSGFQTNLSGNAGNAGALIIDEYISGGGSGSGGSGSGSSNYQLMEGDFVDTGATIPATLSQTATVTVGNYVYLIGGYTGAATSRAVYQAPVTNPTSWTLMSSTALPAGISGGQVAIIGSTVYYFGGTTNGGNGGATNVIYSTSTANIGTATAWTNAGTISPASSGVDLSQIAVLNNNIYLFGGVTTAADINTIFVASTSNPLSWSTSGSTLPSNLGKSQLAVIGGYVYLFGGETVINSTVTTAIYRAAVATPTTWTTTTGTLPQAISRASVLVVGNYAYILGGSNGAANNFIYKAPVNDPLVWSYAGGSSGIVKLPMTTSLVDSTAAIVGNAAYLYGGVVNGSNAANIYMAPINNPSPDLTSNPSWKVDENFGGGGSGTSSQTANGNYQLDYKQITSSVTGIGATPASVVSGNSVTYDGTTSVDVEFYSPLISAGGGNGNASYIDILLYEDGSSIGDIAHCNIWAPGTTPNIGCPTDTHTILTPTAGAHTFAVYATEYLNTGQVTAGNGGSGNYVPAFIRIVRANPNIQGGSGINNGTTTQVANFNIQSSNASNITAVIQGAASQSADILEVNDSSNNNLLRVDPNGNTYVKGNLGFSNTGNANQALTINMVVTSSVNAGDVVVIDTSNPGQVTDSAAANSTQIVGIATQTQSAGVAQPIVITGIYQVNVTGTVTVGDYLVTSSTTGTAQDTTSPSGGVIGQAMSTASSGKAWTLIKPQSGAGGSSSGSGGNGILAVVTYTSGSGTFTVPYGVTAIQVEAVGGGGGGGGTAQAGSLATGGGGGAGGYTRKLITSPVSSYSYSVGSAGGGGASGNNAGSPGGDTTFGSLTAKGGSAGGGSTGSSSGTAGAGGVVGSGGDINTPGGPGTPGGIGPSGAQQGGSGGNSQISGGALGPQGTAAGASATGYGGGGSGGAGWAAANAGGSGAGGVIVITEYGSTGSNSSSSSGGGNNYELMESDWTNTGATLPTNLDSSGATVTISNTIYFFGGGDATPTNKIYSAPVSNPTNVTDTGHTLPGNLSVSQVAIIGSNIYLFGGFSGTNATNVIYTATTSNPTTWTNTGATLPGNLGASSLAIIGSYVYLFGGFTGTWATTFTNVIYRASLSAPTTWSTASGTLAISLAYSSLAVVGNYVYMFGGYNGSASGSIQRASISNPGGTGAGAWTNMAGYGIPAGLDASSLAIIGNYIYLMSGSNGSSNQSVVYRAPVNSPITWGSAGGVLPGTLAYSSAVIAGNALYLYGGNGTNVIYSAPIVNPSPDLSSNPSWKVDQNTSGSGGSSSSSSSGSYQLDYQQITSTVNLPTSGSSGSPVSIIGGNSVTYDGSTKVMIDVYSPGVTGPGGYVHIELLRDSTVIGDLTNSVTPTAFYGEFQDTPSAGAHTYYVKGYNTNAGTAGSFQAGLGNGVGVLMPAFMRITLANPSFSSGSSSSSSSGSSGSFRLDYQQITSNQTVTTTESTVITGNSVTYDGTQVKLEAYFGRNYQSGGSGSGQLWGEFYRDTTNLGQFFCGNDSANHRPDCYGSFYDTPSAGAHTYYIKAYTTSGTAPVDTIECGTGGTTTALPCYLLVTRANPSLQGSTAGAILNQTTTQTANFNIQSASSSSVTATIQGASSQSADILDVKDGSGNILFGVAPTGIITLGPASSTPDILVLGTKNTSGDPGTCTAGGIYYNSADNLFRGCANSTWQTLNGMTKLADVNLSGSQATFDFTSIPNIFSSLKLQLYLRGTNATNSVSCELRMNNDSGSNYIYHWIGQTSNSATPLTVGTAQGTPTTSVLLSSCHAATSTASMFDSITVDIPNYANTVGFKPIDFTSTEGPNESAGAGGGMWQSTSAINELTILPSAGSWAAGSRAILWGTP